MQRADMNNGYKIELWLTITLFRGQNLKWILLELMVYFEIKWQNQRLVHCDLDHNLLTGNSKSFKR